MSVDRLKRMYPFHSPPTSHSSHPLSFCHFHPSFPVSAAIGSESFIKRIIKNAQFCSFYGRILNKRGTAEALLREKHVDIGLHTL